jgi:hypothetical protein
MVWIIPSLVAAAVALLYGILLQRRAVPQLELVGSSPSQTEENATFVIGDLHGDVNCARFWIGKTNLIENFSSLDTSAWRWRDPSSTLIFMGDYIDKGPTSRQTVELVMTLTEQFPAQVTALMGNHELELLKDRDEERGYFYFQLPYAVVHPAEYLNYLDSPPEDTDELVIDLLYNASIEVYSLNLYRFTRIAPTSVSEDSRLVSITEYVNPKHHRQLVSERLEDYQKSYLDSYRSDTKLGRWLENRPIAHLTEDGTLFVHGGISEPVARHIFSGGRAAIDELNRQMKLNAHEKDIIAFLETSMLGEAVEDLVTYRGNHESCSDLVHKILPQMPGVKRLAVGHTPEELVRVECDGSFLALDSLLGRWIRATGNNYCPPNATDRQFSINGRYACEPIEQSCEGQIVKLLQTGEVVIIETTSG